MRSPISGLRSIELYGPLRPTLDILRISSARARCCGFNCSMVSCGNRGSGLVGGGAAAAARSWRRLTRRMRVEPRSTYSRVTMVPVSFTMAPLRARAARAPGNSTSIECGPVLSRYSSAHPVVSPPIATRPPWSVPLIVTSWAWFVCAMTIETNTDVKRRTSREIFMTLRLYCSRFPGMSSPFNVAVVQSSPVVFEPKATLAKVRELTANAAKSGAKLVVFPEAFVSAYPKGLDFGARVGMRTPQGRDDFRRYFDSAIDVPGLATEQLGRAARENKVYLVIGVIERDIGTLYCTVVFFAPDGAFLGKHRKLMPTAMERLIWGFGDGSTLPVYETPYGRLGAVICWENYMPLLRMAMYSKGIQLYCAPTADDRDTWIPTMQHVALEGRCFVLSACQYLTRADCPADYASVQGNDPATVLMRGGS